MDKEAFKNPEIWIRTFQFILAIIAFAPVAAGVPFQTYSYAVWCGVSTMVLCAVYNYCYLRTSGLVHGIGPFIVDTIWWVFWLALAGALSAVLDGFDDANPRGGVPRRRAAAACVFSWLNWGLFTAAVVLDGIDHFGSRGVTVTLPNPVTARMADGRLVQASTLGMGSHWEGTVAPASADELVSVHLDGKD